MKYVLLSLLVGLFSCSGDDEPKTAEKCGDGGDVVEGYCVFSQPITEEGFLCPISFQTGLFTYGALTLCAGPGLGRPGLDLRDLLVQRYPLQAPAEECLAVVCDDLTYCIDGVCGGPTTDPLAECLDVCDPICLAPEAQSCAESGLTYCNRCLLDCYEETPAELTACAGGGDPAPCVAACPTDCEGEGVCASDGQTYCTRCEIACNRLATAHPSNCQ